ncbi:hypothetical protein BsWGS_05605 [Bradybaena similaris]
MAIDPAFENAGASVGLEIWRIEKLKVVRQDAKTYGEFYSGDSYIVLSTKKQRNSPKLEWDLHFWLGSRTSQVSYVYNNNMEFPFSYITKGI